MMTPLPRPADEVRTDDDRDVQVDHDDGAWHPRPAAPGGFGAWLEVVVAANPFYLISACLVLYGLHGTFQDPGMALDRWLLFGMLQGYTLLIATAAVVLVRFGRVWDDARSVILIIVLLLLATSVSLDEMVAEHLESGASFVIVGLGLAMLFSEVVMRASRIRLPILYRLPYHLILTVFYLYPILLGTLLADAVETLRFERLAWAHALYPVAAGAAFCALIPAIRRGPGYVAKNGTPWAWPQFPWSLYVIAGAGVVFRVWLGPISYWSAPVGTNPFGPWLLAPLVLVAAVLLLEIAREGRRVKLERLALLLPPSALVLAFPGAPESLAPEASFLPHLLAVGAAPALVVTLLAAAFYLFALVRGARGAEIGLIAALALLAVVGGSTVDLRSLVAPRAAPVALIGVFQAAMLVRDRRSWRALASAAALILALTIGLRGTWLTAGHGTIPVHALVGATLALGLLFRDALARRLEDAGTIGLGALFAAGVIAGRKILPDLPAPLFPIHAAALLVAVGALWWVRRNPIALWVTLADLVIWSGRGTLEAYRFLDRPDRPRGASFVFWGLVFFAVAALVSFIKSGKHRGMVAAIGRLIEPPAPRGREASETGA